MGDAIERLLAAQQAKLAGEKRSSEKAWYPISLETAQKALDKDFETQQRLIYKDIAYSMQFLHFLLHARSELYTSYVMKRMFNKQVVVLAGSIIEGLLKSHITEEDLQNSSLTNKQIKNMTFERYIIVSDLSDDMKEKLHSVRKLRNNVHIEDGETAKSKEFVHAIGNEVLDTLYELIATYYPATVDTFPFLTDEDLRVTD